MFRRLAVFTAGCSFEAAESVCASGGALDARLADILEPLATLVDQSLLRHHSGPGDESRFWMLETIREYGLEQLEASGEIDAIRQAHADYFLALAEAAEPELTGPRQSRWLDRLEAELDNFQAALVFSINTGSVETGLRLAAALWRFWQVRGHLREARTWLTRMLSVPAPVGQTAGRAKALNAAGFLAFLLGDYPEAEGLHREGLAIRRSLADPVGIAESLHNLGLVARCLNEYTLACTLYEEALQVNREPATCSGNPASSTATPGCSTTRVNTSVREPCWSATWR